MGNAAAATIELGKHTGVRDNHFNRAGKFTKFSENEISLVSIDIAGIVDFKSIILHEFMGFF